MINQYSNKIEVQMQELYSRLTEKDKRLYAGIEASKLPYGGITYIAKLFGCSRETISTGIKELAEPEILPPNRSRKVGGGRKQVLETKQEINEVFLQLLKEHTAGDPPS